MLDLCEAEVVQMVISRQILVEADRNFCAKLPNLVIQFRQFIRDLAILLVEDPSAKAVQKAAHLVHAKDVSILAPALESEADYLITLDKKHFLKQKDRCNLPIEICTPAEFLRIYERIWLQD